MDVAVVEGQDGTMLQQNAGLNFPFASRIAELLEHLPDLRHRRSVLNGAIRSLRRELDELLKVLESDCCTFKEWTVAHRRVKSLLSVEAYEELVTPRYYRIATPTLVALVTGELRPAAKSQLDPMDCQEAIAKIAGSLGLSLTEKDKEDIEFALLKGGAVRGAWELVSKITGESPRTIGNHCREHEELLDE